MSDAREVVLSRVREALRLRGPVALDARPEPTPARPPVPLEDLLARFSERVEDFGARVWRADADAVGASVAEALGAERRVAVPGDVDPSWLPPGLDLVQDGPELGSSVLDQVDAAVTAAAVAIAETGTIVLDGGRGQGRRALTLVPDHHVCVLFADQVVADVPDAIVRLDPVHPLTWISGPSATSDIELSRVQGVHGPRRLDVVLVATA
jgi:L-lactate dehydrogenase complex protein LldG